MGTSDSHFQLCHTRMRDNSFGWFRRGYRNHQTPTTRSSAKHWIGDTIPFPSVLFLIRTVTHPHHHQTRPVTKPAPSQRMVFVVVVVQEEEEEEEERMVTRGLYGVSQTIRYPPTTAQTKPPTKVATQRNETETDGTRDMVTISD